MYLKKLILVTLLCFFSLFGLFAAGMMDPDLRAVDQMIKDLNYNDAIEALSEYMVAHPDKFEAAQNRMHTIINTRDRYNKKAQDLINVIVNQPDDDGKKLALIHELENLEKNPTPQTQAFIRETKAAAQFTYYRSQFERILREGKNSIDQKKYYDALTTYGGGFFFYKDEFDDEVAPELKTNVDDRLAKLQVMIAEYPNRAELWEQTLVNFETACQSSNLKEISTSYNALQNTMIQFTTYRNTISQYGWFMESSFSDLKKKEETITENSFLPFAYRFILGRKTIGYYEGIAGALDSQWQNMMQRASDSLYKCFDKDWQASIAEYNQGNFVQIPTNMAQCRSLTDVFINVFEFAKLIERSPSGTFSPSGTDLENVHIDWDSDVSDAKYLSLLCTELESIAKLNSEVNQHLQAVASYVPEPITLQQLSLSSIPSLAYYVSQSIYFDSTLSTISDIQKRVQSYESDKVNSFSYDEELKSNLNSLTENISNGRYDSLYQSVLLRAQLCQLASSSHTDEFNNAAKYADGIKNGEGEYSTIYYYPSECLTAMQLVQKDIVSDITRIQTQIADARKAGNSVASVPEYDAQIQNMLQAERQLADLQAKSNKYISNCRVKIREATLAIQEAERAFSDAETALKQGNFERARARLERARSSYSDALKLQNSDSIRSSSDTKLASLGDEIIKQENEAVIRDVRQYLSSAKTAYYAGDFNTAADRLNLAASRWSTTHVEEDPEVKKWTGIVNTALSMKTGRTIPVSAPLYPEMSQLLSLANQYYVQGKNQIKKGNTERGRELLTTAQNKLEDVKMVYPLNQDASLLSLRISQVLDEKASNELFARMFESASTNYKVEGKSQEAYSDLLDLREINPNYPGLKNLIYNVELYLGIIIPPPDQKAIAKSRQLTRQAQSIVDANNRSMFPVALQQLEQAIDIWPENTTALTLKDKVQIATGGKETVVLSFADEELYQTAVEELRKGNTLLAASYVNRLLENTNNRYSSKIIELDKRIKGML